MAGLRSDGTCESSWNGPLTATVLLPSALWRRPRIIVARKVWAPASKRGYGSRAAAPLNDSSQKSASLGSFFSFHPQGAPTRGGGSSPPAGPRYPSIPPARRLQDRAPGQVRIAVL